MLNGCVDPRILHLCQGTLNYTGSAVQYSSLFQHFLRDEPGAYYQDLYPLISFLPRHANGVNGELLPLWREAAGEGKPVDSPATELGREASEDSSMREEKLKGRKGKHVDLELALPHVYSDRPLLPARNPPVTSAYDYIPLLRLFKWAGRKITGKVRTRQKGKRKVGTDIVESHIPLEIILVLSK